MNVIFFHGKLSTPETTNTGKAIKKFFELADHKVYIVDYKPENTPVEISIFIRDYIKDIISVEEDTVFIGISLGGFWALNTANRTPNCSCVLLNPCLDYYGFTIKPKSGLPLSVILNVDDELIDARKTAEMLKGRAKIDLVPSGGHRMTNIKDLLPLILYNAQSTDCL